MLLRRKCPNAPKVYGTQFYLVEGVTRNFVVKSSGLTLNVGFLKFKHLTLNIFLLARIVLHSRDTIFQSIFVT